jgi:NAD(P)-dependent dehydrogenase (short-subunit alcohol dehydrogenase family)
VQLSRDSSSFYTGNLWLCTNQYQYLIFTKLCNGLFFGRQSKERRVAQPSYLILGSTGVIGRALCARLARRGCSLVLGGRDPEKLNELASATGGRACPGDARDAATVERAIAQAVERYGRFDGAVNLVNLIGSSRFEAAHSPKSGFWSERVAENLRPAFHLVHCAAKALREGGGSIVLVSLPAAASGTLDHEAIAVAAASVKWFTRSATADFAAQNVRVNCVAPGLVRTPLANRLTDLPTRLAAWDALRHLGCTSDPEDVAAAIAWLLDPANSRVSGQVVSVDGGLALLHGGARA